MGWSVTLSATSSDRQFSSVEESRRELEHPGGEETHPLPAPPRTRGDHKWSGAGPAGRSGMGNHWDDGVQLSLVPDTMFFLYGVITSGTGSAAAPVAASTRWQPEAQAEPELDSTAVDSNFKLPVKAQAATASDSDSASASATRRRRPAVVRYVHVTLIS